ncbi:unnamed protein product, partial [Rotaria magnacalcarata]
MRTLLKLGSLIFIGPQIRFQFEHGTCPFRNTHASRTKSIHRFIVGVPKAVASQCLGGIFFSIFAGQPLIVVMTTAPLTLYVKVIYTLCGWYGLDFRDTYALVGLWNSFFLIIYSIFGVSKIMKWST